MKLHSMQSKFLLTVIAALLSLAVLIGGISIYEVDGYIQSHAEYLLQTTCKNQALRINKAFSAMEKSVDIMESYVLDLFSSNEDITDRSKQAEIIRQSERMFADVAMHTDGTVAYYLRLSPEISDSVTGMFFSKEDGKGDFIRFEVTDIGQYDRDDTEHVGWYWQPYDAQRPIWMLPYYNRNNGILMISYVVPLYYDGQFIGIVGMDFDYTVLTAEIDRIKIYEHGFAHLEFNSQIAYHRELPPGSAAPDLSENYMQAAEPIQNGMTLVLSASRRDIDRTKNDMALKILCFTVLLTTLFSVIVILIVRKIVGPLKELTEAAKKLSGGNFNVDTVPSNTYEIRLLSDAFEKMTACLKAHDEHQQYLAYNDSLTGLRNTTAYKAWVTGFDQEVRTRDVNFGVVVLDINDLKIANDRYGHSAGNKLITTTARIISMTFSQSPVFRIGGDEFVVILLKGDLENCRALLKACDKACKNAVVKADGQQIPVSVAKGFAIFDAQRDASFADVFTRADDAMYKNKRKMKKDRL